MTNAVSVGETKRPVPAAWSDGGYVWKTMAAAALGIGLFCGGYTGALWLGFKDWNLMSNFMATPLFVLPLIVALFRARRPCFPSRAAAR